MSACCHMTLYCSSHDLPRCQLAQVPSAPVEAVVRESCVQRFNSVLIDLSKAEKGLMCDLLYLSVCLSVCLSACCLSLILLSCLLPTPAPEGGTARRGGSWGAGEPRGLLLSELASFTVQLLSVKEGVAAQEPFSDEVHDALRR